MSNPPPHPSPRSIWNLDLLVAVLPPVSLLLQSKHEPFVRCGYDALKLMIKNYAVMIKNNMSGPVHSVGVDISREERLCWWVGRYEMLCGL